MVTMIERVALVVRDEIADIDRNGRWALDEGFRDEGYFRELARAIIAAMRDPTEAMVKAGNGSKPYNLVGYCEGTIYPVVQRSWPAMIGAALAEPAAADVSDSPSTVPWDPEIELNRDPDSRPADDDLAGWSRYYAGRFSDPADPLCEGLPWGQGRWAYTNDCQSCHLQQVAEELERRRR